MGKLLTRTLYNLVSEMEILRLDEHFGQEDVPPHGGDLPLRKDLKQLFIQYYFRTEEMMLEMKT